jgi:hypothetical protein
MSPAELDQVPHVGTPVVVPDHSTGSTVTVTVIDSVGISMYEKS